MVVVSATAMVVALVSLLLALHPLPPTVLGPQVSLAPGIGVGLGDSSPAVPGRTFAVAPAHAAGGSGGVGGPALAVAASVAQDGPRAVASLAPARAVAVVVAGAPARTAPRQPAPVVTPQPPPVVVIPEPPSALAPEPVATPVEAPAPEPVAALPVQVPYAPGFQPGPVSAGVEPPAGFPAELLEVRDGDEGDVSFQFVVEPSSFAAPGEDNSIVRFAGPAGETPTFALQLWDDGAGQRGLWSSGDAMGGERFLAPLSEGEHELSVEFVASSEEDGLYRVAVEGLTVDWRAWVSLLPAAGGAWLETQP